MVPDLTVQLGKKSTIEYHQELDETDWKVTFVDTTEHAQTGHRVWRLRNYLPEEGSFFLTYGDGVSNVNIRALLDAHLASNCVGTLTGVRMPSRFGELEIREGRVITFREKPAYTTQSQINGGFMVFDAERIWNYLSPEPALKFEKEPLEKMVADGQLSVFEHEGYWQCMDTPREFVMLNTLWAENKAPWRVW
jgi:glucose-1-phosphate cytidylyltransferase